MTRFHPYRRRKPYLLAASLILVALLISLSALRDLAGLRSAFISSVYPFQFVAMAVWNGLTGFPKSVVGTRQFAAENKNLTRQVKELKAELVVVKGLQSENKRLRRANSFKVVNPYSSRLMLAQVIGRAPSPWFSILEINKGSGAGVKKNMAVVNQVGLVGKVIEVSRFSSKVRLLTDSDSSIAAINARSRDQGIVSGKPSGRLYMKYVSAGADIREGDKITTSAISRFAPGGIALGRVTKATKKEHDLFYQIELAPVVDFSKLEEVFVLY